MLTPIKKKRKAGVAILISEKADFRTRNIIGAEGH